MEIDADDVVSELPALLLAAIVRLLLLNTGCAQLSSHHRHHHQNTLFNSFKLACFQFMADGGEGHLPQTLPPRSLGAGPLHCSLPPNKFTLTLTDHFLV